MQIIDFEKKGNVVRFYLGNDDLESWYGDDWDDTPYEHNAGQVYNEFVAAIKDVAFPFDDLILEPAEDYKNDGNSEWCKEDMIQRRVPCIIQVPQNIAWYGEDKCFSRYAGMDGVIKFYLGDHMEP